jgi:hypothetical protein
MLCYHDGMAKRRTKQQKIAANWKRQFENHEIKVINNPPRETINTVKNEPVPRKDFYVPEFSLSTNLLIRDLTKSLAVTILALILQFSLAAYLNHGGWQTVNNMLQKFATNI